MKDPHSEPMGRVAFMKEPKGSRGDAPQTPICNLNVALPDNITPDVPGLGDADSLAAIQQKVYCICENVLCFLKFIKPVQKCLIKFML